MAEVLVEFSEVVVADDGVRYHAHACGGPMGNDGAWHGWVEFTPIAGGAPIRSGRETTQPNRTDTAYWATGLTPVYLEGALRRALHPRLTPESAPVDEPSFDEPALTRHAVLDPFSVYEKEGEAPLRNRLAALSNWHLVNIIEAYGLSREPTPSLNRMAAAALIDRIAAGVRSNRTRNGRRSAS